MIRRAAAGAAVGLGLVFVQACAAPHEEAPSRSAEQPDAINEEPGEYEDQVAPTPVDEAGPRDLAQMELELEANNARLRELGVELPSTKAEAAADPKPSGGDGLIEPSPAGSGAGSVAQPGTAPSTGAKTKRPRDRKDGGRKPASKPKKDGDKAGAIDDGLGPEEAKSAPPAPTDGPREQDAAQVCQQICDLGAISCEIKDQICELAERHPDEDDYVSACERAVGDCEAAKEACDACVE